MLVRKTVYQDIDVEVDVDLSDFDTDELIEEIESRESWMVIDKEDSGAFSESMKDEIYNLYRDYVTGNNFDRKLKKFFEENIGIVVA